MLLVAPSTAKERGTLTRVAADRRSIGFAHVDRCQLQPNFRRETSPREATHYARTEGWSARPPSSFGRSKFELSFGAQLPSADRPVVLVIRLRRSANSGTNSPNADARAFKGALTGARATLGEYFYSGGHRRSFGDFVYEQVPSCASSSSRSNLARLSSSLSKRRSRCARSAPTATIRRVRSPRSPPKRRSDAG